MEEVAVLPKYDKFLMRRVVAGSQAGEVGAASQSRRLPIDPVAAGRVGARNDDCHFSTEEIVYRQFDVFRHADLKFERGSGAEWVRVVRVEGHHLGMNVMGCGTNAR